MQVNIPACHRQLRLHKHPLTFVSHVCNSERSVIMVQANTPINTTAGAPHANTLLWQRKVPLNEANRVLGRRFNIDATY